MAKIQKKCSCPSQKTIKFIQGVQKQSQNKIFPKRPLETTENLFYEKSYLKRSRLMLYRCRLAEIGGNWLKLAKTVSYVYEFVSFFNAIHVISLRSSLVVFCSADLKVHGSNPARGNFFLFFPFSGQIWVQTPLEFTSFFPTWNSLIFTIYGFFIS